VRRSLQLCQTTLSTESKCVIKAQTFFTNVTFYVAQNRHSFMAESHEAHVRACNLWLWCYGSFTPDALQRGVVWHRAAWNLPQRKAPSIVVSCNY